jgi:hypothetical protein
MLGKPPTRIWLALGLFMTMFVSRSYSQYVTSAQGLGLGAGTALTGGGLGALDWNPAAMTGGKEVEFSQTSILSLGSPSLLAFGSGGGAAMFGSQHEIAVRATPALSLNFVIPSTISIQDSTQKFITTFDKKISYSENLAVAYAYRMDDKFSAGIAAHEFQEDVTNTSYSQNDTTGSITSSLAEYVATIWTLDAGVTWSPTSEWRFGLVVKDFTHVNMSSLPSSISQFTLLEPTRILAGIGYAGFDPVKIGVDAGTDKRFRIGSEYSVSSAWQLRSGVYFDDSSPVFVDAVSAGAGGTIDRFHFDLAYLKFMSEVNRRGSADLQYLGQIGVDNLQYNAFTGDRLIFTAQADIGRREQEVAKIEYVDMVSEIFPAARTQYAFRPVGKARVRNVTEKPLVVRANFFVDKLMDHPTETASVRLDPGELKEIPFYAVFNDAIASTTSLTVHEGTVGVTASEADAADDEYQIRVLIHGRNDWNGDVAMLKYFMTPAAPEIVSYTRSVMDANKAVFDTVVAERGNLARAIALFNDFSSRLSYVNDPRTSQDNVQYPAETLRLRGGDCDDMSVTYASLLASIGIQIAFVDVVPPDHPDSAHVYMMFDSGIPASDGPLLSDNPKRFVVRKNAAGVETAWLPVETTVIAKGFDAAWEDGAREYFHDAEVNLGLVKGWMRIVDVDVTD